MPIVVPCKCGKRLKALDHQAGKKVRCPACQTLMVVPDFTAFADLEVSDDQTEVFGLADSPDGGAAPVESATFTGGIGVIKVAEVPQCVAIGPAKTWALAACNDTVQVIDAKSWKKAYKLAGHSETIRCLAVSREHDLALSGDDDGRLILWQLASESGRKLRGLSGHRGGVHCITFAPAGFVAASGGEDGVVRLWELKGGRERILEKARRESPISALTFARDGSLLLAAIEDDRLGLWDAKSGDFLRSLRGARSVESVALAHDASFAVAVSTGSRSPRVWKWETRTGKELSCWENPSKNNAKLSCAIAVPGGLRVLSAGVLPKDWSKTIERSDFRQGLERASMTGMIGGVPGLVGNILGTASLVQDAITMHGQDCNCLQVWNIVNGSVVHTYRETAARAACLAVNPEGTRALAGMQDSTVTTWGLPP